MIYVDFFYEFIINLVGVISDVFNWFITPISIPALGYEIAPIWAMFGSGLVVLLGVIVIKSLLS